jgi:major membrane immunogen (membrane-anchored lipoprotein)
MAEEKEYILHLESVECASVSIVSTSKKKAIEMFEEGEYDEICNETEFDDHEWKVKEVEIV